MLDVAINTFANGEKRVRIHEGVHSENICLVQSFSNPVDENIVEFLLLCDALERAGARHINLVLPWMGYSLQDKVFRSGEAIAAKVIANLISNAHVKRAYLLDVHNTSIPGFFSIPTHHFTALDLFAAYVQEHFDLTQAIVVSPDFGGIKRASVFADKLKLDLANVDKFRDLDTGKVTPQGISGSVKDKICFIYDDVINTGGTVVEVAKFLKQQGAQEVHFVVTHGIFANDGLEKTNDPAIDSLIITNSIYHPNLPARVTVLDCAPIFAQTLKKWI